MKKYLLKVVALIIYFLGFNCNLVLAQFPPDDLSKKIKIEHLKIEGSSFTDEISLILAPYLNQEIKWSEISTLQNIINQFYQNQGYLVSFAIIPLQEIEDGVLFIRVIEGKIVNVEVEGNSALSDNYIKARLKKSLTSVPFNVQTLETELQLLQQNPLIKRIKAELRPDLELGNSGIKLIISESPTTTISISADNDFSPSLGDFGGAIALEKRSLLVGGDIALGQSTFTPGLEQYKISYGIPINSADGTVTLSYQNSQSNIVEGATQNSEIALRYSVQAFEPNKWTAGTRGQTAIKLSQKPI